ncbi:MAG: TIGR04076 family protein [Succinivibrio sp.]|nr:TIGR04076 family protein [Succinivibrio sp.]
MPRPTILITLMETRGPLGSAGCHHHHRVGQSWDFDRERGDLCPMALHVGFVYADILRYGGQVPGNPRGTALFACPDPKVLNIFKIEVLEEIRFKDIAAQN